MYIYIIQFTVVKINCMGINTIQFAKKGVISGMKCVKMFTLLYSKYATKSAAIIILAYLAVQL